MDRQLMDNMQRAFPSYIRLINLINCSSSDRFAKGTRKTFSSRGLEIPWVYKFPRDIRIKPPFRWETAMFFLSKIARWHPIRPILAASIISIRRCRTKSNVNGIDSPSWILLANESLPLPLTDAIFKNSSRNDASRNLHLSSTSIFSCIQDRLKKYTLIGYFSIRYTLSEFRYN